MPDDIKKLQDQIDDLKKELSLVSKDAGVYLDRYIDNNSKVIIQQAVAEKILDIVWTDYFYYSSTFESLDRYFTPASGAVQSINDQGMILTTTGTGANETGFLLYVSSDLISTQRECRFRVSNKLDSITSVNWRAYTLVDSLTTSYIGFEMTSGSIFGVTSKAGARSTVNLGTYAANTFYKLELRYYPGTRLDFYVNDQLQGSVTSNFPIAVPDSLFQIHTAETSASARTSTTSYFDFIQKKGSQ